jgi:hypothetical protein
MRLVRADRAGRHRIRHQMGSIRSRLSGKSRTQATLIRNQGSGIRHQEAM